MSGEAFPPLEGCDASLYEVVTAACAYDPALRPTAAALHDALATLEIAPTPEYAQAPVHKVDAGFEQGTGSVTQGVWSVFGESGKVSASAENVAATLDSHPAAGRAHIKDKVKPPKAEKPHAEQSNEQPPMSADVVLVADNQAVPNRDLDSMLQLDSAQTESANPSIAPKRLAMYATIAVAMVVGAPIGYLLGIVLYGHDGLLWFLSQGDEIVIWAFTLIVGPGFLAYGVYRLWKRLGVGRL